MWENVEDFLIQTIHENNHLHHHHYRHAGPLILTTFVSFLPLSWEAKRFPFLLQLHLRTRGSASMIGASAMFCIPAFICMAWAASAAVSRRNWRSGGHDPQREAFSAQAIEPGLSLRTKYVEGFANYLFFQDAEGDWDGELEEAFGKIVNIPGGFELKGGQYLSRFGALNDKHLHAWDFVDSEMVLSRFLGDDGLLLQGGELSWTLPFGMDPAFVSIASLGFGNARAHEHEPRTRSGGNAS